MLKGYDNHHILLLPPRMPGEKLPLEVLEYFEEQKKIQGDQEGLNLDNGEGGPHGWWVCGTAASKEQRISALAFSAHGKEQTPFIFY